MFKNKILLITGGTGSFGKTILNRFIKSDIREIRIFSRDEKKQDDMRHKFNNSKIKFYIGDIRQREAIDEAMIGVDYLFHAAALKQVPSCEFFPMQAVHTNIIGTENVLNAAIKNNVKKVVVLSTDKACYPVNAMGISKAMMEKVAIAKSRTQQYSGKTTICITRYGNILASRGSVIPVFIKQLKENLDLNVTDPKMTRFIMSLEESVDLVLYAWKNGKNGDLFVQKAQSSSIETLAKSLISIYKSNKKIKVIGTRHGEKLHETLVTREEMSRCEDLGEYYRIPADNRNLNYDKYFIKGQEKISSIPDYQSDNTYVLKENELKKILLKLDFIKNDLKHL